MGILHVMILYRNLNPKEVMLQQLTIRFRPPLMSNQLYHQIVKFFPQNSGKENMAS